jgi:acetyltransferase-like isoleucine patch superfamily enzyme
VAATLRADMMDRLRMAVRRQRLGIHDRSVRVGPRASIDPRVRLGHAVTVEEGVRLRGHVTVGDHSSVRAYTILDGRNGPLVIGRGSSVNPFCYLDAQGGITIGDGVRVAPHVTMFSTNHRFDRLDVPIAEQGLELAPITIADDVWIGSHVTILAGVSIGKGSVIGAGSVVTRGVAPGVVAVGNPARFLRMRGDATGG